MALRGKIRVGVVGAGIAAQGSHLPWYRLHPRARLTAVADTDEAKLRLVTALFGVPRAYRDASELFASGQVDAVSICTPPWCHERQVVEAAQAGIHVLCEKPLATSVAEARRMLRAAADAGVILQVGFQKRFHEGFRKIKRMIAEGRLGEIMSARAHWYFWYPDVKAPPFNGIVRAAGRLGVELENLLGFWRFTDSRTRGCSIIDYSIHYVDLLRHMMGEVLEVSCETSTVCRGRAHEDQSLLALRFESGALGFIEHNLNVVGRSPGEESGVIQGTKGSVRFRVAAPNSPVPFRMERYTYANVLTDRWTASRFVPGTEIRQYRDQIDFFVGSIAGEVPRRLRDAAPDTGEDSLRSLRIVSAAYRSAREGRRIRIRSRSPADG
ncbi:MAG: Gfo/Idh/MocA family oxidoreductase [bacterium]